MHFCVGLAVHINGCSGGQGDPPIPNSRIPCRAAVERDVHLEIMRVCLMSEVLQTRLLGNSFSLLDICNHLSLETTCLVCTVGGSYRQNNKALTESSWQ